MVGHLENMWQNMINVAVRIKTKIIMSSFKDALDIGENMAILKEDGKSFTILNKETGKLRRIVSEEGRLLVDDGEIDFDAIEKGCPDFEGGKYVEYYFGIFREFKNGVCAICWTVYPDGRYFADEDGFGMEHNNEENAYCIINRNLEIIVPFQPMKDVATVLKGYERGCVNSLHF